MAQSCELMGTTRSSEGLIWEVSRLTEVNLVMELEYYGQANTCNFTCMLLFSKSNNTVT